MKRQQNYTNATNGDKQQKYNACLKQNKSKIIHNLIDSDYFLSDSNTDHRLMGQ